MKKPAIYLVSIVLILFIVWHFAGDGVGSLITGGKIEHETVQGVLSAGESHVVVLGDGNDLYGWGKNSDQQLVQKNPAIVNAPIRITSSADWRFVHAGTGATYAISNSNVLWQYTYKPDRNDTPHAFSSVFSGFEWAKVQESWGSVSGLDTDGNLWTWLHDDFIPGITNKEPPTRPTPIEPQQSWVDFCNIGAKLYAVAADGSLWKNIDTTPEEPEGPRTTRKKRYLPELERIPSDARLQRVICRQNAAHILAIDENNYLWGFGHNSFGELGDGDGEVGTRPVNVAENEMKQLTDMQWIDVALGHNFTVGIASDGSLWGWGRPFSGVLGIGEIPRSFSADTDMPRLADDTRSWLAVTAGNSFSAGVTTDGDVYTWGAQALASGGNSGARLVPTKIESDLVLDVPATD